ncbi:MAG: class I SAM-dependent methyltransferase [Patescibacteria group bacterium]|nr:class I SAM-dependent methyltransferase [Patescibacteria group bacterium]
MKNIYKLSPRKKKEIKTFSDLTAYEELMSRPYFVYLKQKITQELEKYHFKKKKILEIGAGRSEFLSLFDKDNEVTALDISPVLLKENKGKVKLVVGDAENLLFPDQSFDFVYMVGVLHHLENQKKALEEIARVLKTGGQVFISEPTKWSLNLPYYLTRRFAILLMGEKKYQKISGCGSPEETFVDLKLCDEVFADSWNIEKQKHLPLRMPPVGFLEKQFSKKLNDFFEKLPFVNNFGSIVFITGQKKPADLGFGTEYEKYILEKIAVKMINKYKIKSVLEYPQNQLLGERKVFKIPKRQTKPDLVWNFCAFEQTTDTHEFIKSMADLTNKYVLIITQNYLNPGVLIHWLFHFLSGKKWDHGQLSKMSGWSAKQTFRKAGVWEIRELGVFDIPWFILDVYETGKYFRNLPFLKSKIEKIKESRFENWPKWLKFFLAHHHYLLMEKTR